MAGRDIVEKVKEAALKVFKRLRILLSDKLEANRPFDTTFEALGARHSKRKPYLSHISNYAP